MNRLRELKRRQLTLSLAYLLLGVVFLLSLRFIMIAKTEVHYHANFAVYVNGQRELFDNFIYYEEVQACGGDELNNPRSRIHMHDFTSHVVHVHDNAATWGHLFANLGWGLGADYLKTADGVMVDGQGGELNFLLNGQPVGSVYNQHVGNEDVLLISFGNESETQLKQQYDSIVADAADFNNRNDPSACTGGKSLTLTERLKRTLRFWE